MKTCDGCGHDSEDTEWMHTFDHPLKEFGHRREADHLYQEPVTTCGFCYTSVVGSRLALSPLQTEPILDELYREVTKQSNVLRELIVASTTHFTIVSEVRATDAMTSIVI